MAVDPHIVERWRRLRLGTVQTALDQAAADIAIRQDEADISRKKLVEQSKLFKQTATEDVRKHVSPLMKSFQLEIDSLTKRSLYAETAFLDVYKKIAEMPDPTPMLEMAAQWQTKAQKMNDLEMEVGNLRQTLASYNLEFAEIKNQEVTIRQLREKIKSYETEMENAIQTKLTEQENELKNRFDERERQMIESESMLTIRVDEAERRADNLQKSLTSAQQELFELRLRIDRSQDARSDQFDMIAADLERANQRAEAAEREVTLLMKRVEKDKDARKSESDNDQHIRDQMATLEAEISAKDKQILQLLDENRKLNGRFVDESFELRSKIEKLDATVQEKCEQIEMLESKISAQTDYDDLKRELRVLKSLEFGSVDDECDQQSTTNKTLEMLLLEKNRALQADNASLRVNGHQREGNSCHHPPSSSSSSSDSPLQTVVNAIGCIVGREVISERYPNSRQRRIEKHLRREQRRINQDQMHDKNINDQQGDGTANDMSADILAMLMEIPKRKDKKSNQNDTDSIRICDDSKPNTIVESSMIGQLQTLVADNVRNLGQRPLNTVEIARQCKRLMVAYNLGQRLFAKIVMNQSQGSLSELLAKPRQWNRLTEKGREAFRRIYAWISDERAIDLLCAISPRRIATTIDTKIDHPSADSLLDNGDHRSITKSSSDDDDDVNNSREPGVDHHRRHDSLLIIDADDNNANSKSGCIMKHSPRMSKSINNTNSSSRWRHDDIPKEKILDIFQTELAKLKEQETSLEKAMRCRPPQPPPPRNESNNSATGCSPTSSHCSSPSPSSSIGADRKRRCTITERLSNSLVKLEQLTNMSPLPTETNANNIGTNICRSKIGLSPITQDQFESFPHLNTDEVVRQVKDFLSANCISQRQFGEYVLGLSQGSVSDLLARPKMWNMLTQKGREPFIRMKLFLDDSNASIAFRSSLIRKRTSSPSQSIDDLPTLVPKTSLSMQSSSSIDALFDDHNDRRPSSNASSSFYAQSPTTYDGQQQQASTSRSSTPKYVPVTVKSIAGNALIDDLSSTSSPSPSPAPQIVNNQRHQKITFVDNDDDDCADRLTMIKEVKRQSTTPVTCTKRTMSSTIDPDTSDIVRHVKELLHFHGIAQKTFGDLILGVSPGGTSELLSKPKSWSSLSARGKEPYLKMSNWLRDPENVAKIVGSSIVNGGSGSVVKRNDLVATSHHSTRKRPSSSTTTVLPKKSPRTVISEQQKEALKYVFNHDPHPSIKTNEFLSKELNLSIRTVTNWFHNYRTRQKTSTISSSIKGTVDESNHQSSSTKTGDDSTDDSTSMIDGGPWQQGLIELLKNVNNHGSPVVAFVKSNTGHRTTSTISSVNHHHRKSTATGRLLDKAVARMRQMAAARST